MLFCICFRLNKTALSVPLSTCVYERGSSSCFSPLVVAVFSYGCLLAHTFIFVLSSPGLLVVALDAAPRRASPLLSRLLKLRSFRATVLCETFPFEALGDLAQRTSKQAGERTLVALVASWRCSAAALRRRSLVFET